MLKLAIFVAYAGVFWRFSFGHDSVRISNIFKLSIMLIFVWLFLSILSTMGQANDESTLLAFRYLSYFAVFLFILLLRSDLSYIFYKRYSELLYIVALLSFFSYLLSVFQLTSTNELVTTGGRTYLTSFFNILMQDSKIEFGGVTFYRFQSIFEEPGTFAFLLLPVIYWYKMVSYNRIKFICLILMLLCTLSIGAIFSAIIIYLVYFFINKPLWFLPSFIVLVVMAVFSLILFPEFLDFLAQKFGMGAYEGKHSSFGVRVLEVSFVMDIFTSHVLGVGFSASNIFSTFGNNISVGLFRQILYSGSIGGLAIVSLNICIIAYALRKLAVKNNIAIFVGFTLLTFIFMGLQRSTFIDGFMFVTLFSFTLKLNSPVIVGLTPRI